jgi:uncharacterized membrane protein YeiH
MEHTAFVVVDLLGTIAFAISGATAATERRLDLFGVYAVAFITAIGGGMVRDLCLGAVPPVGISDWRYLAGSVFAATLTIWAGPWVEHLKNPVAIFDSVGLGFFAVAGAHKAFSHGGHVEPAIVLGVVTAVGGGVMRDVLLNRLPVILAKRSTPSRRSSLPASRCSPRSTVCSSILRRSWRSALVSCFASSPFATRGRFPWRAAEAPSPRRPAADATVPDAGNLCAVGKVACGDAAIGCQ